MIRANLTAADASFARHKTLPRKEGIDGDIPITEAIATRQGGDGSRVGGEGSRLRGLAQAGA